MLDLFYFIEGASFHFGRKFVCYCVELIDLKLPDKWIFFEKQAISILNKLLKANRWEENKIMSLIDEFDLYKEVSSSKIMDLIGYFNNINDVIYVFQTKKGEIRY